LYSIYRQGVFAAVRTCGFVSKPQVRHSGCDTPLVKEHGHVHRVNWSQEEVDTSFSKMAFTPWATHSKGFVFMTETTLTVPNISCEHCERSVVSALSPTDGVQQVTVDIPSKTVKVVYDAARVKVEDMSAILAAEDYPVASVSQ